MLQLQPQKWCESNSFPLLWPSFSFEILPVFFCGMDVARESFLGTSLTSKKRDFSVSFADIFKYLMKIMFSGKGQRKFSVLKNLA